MENVPNIVRERLKAAKPVVHHPDADVLTAFSEQSLSDRERVEVLDHLAHCGDCRDILALALPEIDAAKPVQHPSSESWFAWPVLRWGFVAAGIVLVASLGVLQYRKHSSSETMAYQGRPVSVASPQSKQEKTQQEEPIPQPSEKKAIPAASAPALAEPQTPVPEALKSPTRELSSTSADRRDETALAIHGKAITAFSAAALPHGPRAANQMQLNANAQQQNTVALPAPTAAPVGGPLQRVSPDLNAKAKGSSGLQNVEGASAAPIVAQTDNLSGAAIQNEPMNARSLNEGQGDAKLSPPKPSAAYTTRAKIAGQETLATSDVSAASKVPNARWNISAVGSLQRSLDQGNTWQDINFTDTSSASPAPMMLAANKRAKELDKDTENNKVERSKAATLVFRAVSANGAEVWAGASGGMLYHSADSGAHWTRVTPSVATGATLTGEILTVAFTDAQHGKVSTSTSELWSTSDGGETWQKQ
jgi:Photosynthesis system II assembly factor YCF48